MTTMLAIEQAVSELLYLREQETHIEQSKRRVESALVSLFDEMGIDSFQTDDNIRVAVEQRPRRTFDVESLLANLPQTVLSLVLKQAVDTSKFDDAVNLGLVPTAVADNATKTSYSTQVRVYGEMGVRGVRS